MKRFDLNIDQILDQWDLANAIREIIANALDEQVLTGSPEPQIRKDEAGRWLVRDFGRGIRHEHFTLNENGEKLEHPGLIGKFGVGLKDALATFERYGVDVRIRSRHCDVSFERSSKHGFEDVVTLHALIQPASDPDFRGTEFVLDGCGDSDMDRAKSLFLRFAKDRILEQTAFGAILDHDRENARIYVNGVRVAEEENFLFSYDITKLNTSIKKALNRERTNVGRTAYSERVKRILLDSASSEVAGRLVDDLAGFGRGSLHDELKWTDVAVHASKITNASRKVVFVSDRQLMSSPQFVEYARSSGHEVVTVPDNVREKLAGAVDLAGARVRDLDTFVEQWKDAFQFEFVEASQLSPEEQAVFAEVDAIAAMVGGMPREVSAIRVSETMRPETTTGVEALGLWRAPEIIIKRSQLQSLETFAGTLLHEIAHARSGAPDVSLRFESELTRLLGQVGTAALNQGALKWQTKGLESQASSAAPRRGLFSWLSRRTP